MPKQLTEKTAKWMETVLANCEANTGRTVPQWLQLARKAKLADAKAAKRWAKEQGLSIVYQTVVADSHFASEQPDDSAMVDSQYAGAKAGLRPVYEAIVKAAQALGDEVKVFPRKSPVTLTRETTFAIIRPAARDRIDLAFRLHGRKSTPRLVEVPKATTSDPSHVVGVRTKAEVDGELTGWLQEAFSRAGPKG